MSFDALSYQSLQGACLVWLVTQIIRTVAERLFPQCVLWPYWAKTVLPLLPVVLGAAGAAFIPFFPRDVSIPETVAAKLQYGAVCGAIAGQGYETIKGVVVTIGKRRFGIDLSFLFGDTKKDE